MSWRWRLGMLSDVGEASWKGREVDLRAVRERWWVSDVAVSLAEAKG